LSARKATGLDFDARAMVMQVWVENRGYFCTLTQCRSSWIRLKMDFQNSSVYMASLRTCLPNVKTVGKCAAELFTIKPNLLLVLGEIGVL